jgi:hypothetical protein
MKKPARPTRKAATRKPAKAGKAVLLSGGNPQIAKAEGDAPVQAWIAAAPGWKRGVGERIDGLVVKVLPGVRKAVKWNSPFYGADPDGWFLSLHCYDRFVRLAFFRGALMEPQPPGPSKVGDVRYLDIREDDATTDKQITAWIRQAIKLPSVKM